MNGEKEFILLQPSNRRVGILILRQLYNSVFQDLINLCNHPIQVTTVKRIDNNNFVDGLGRKFKLKHPIVIGIVEFLDGGEQR